MVAKILEDQSYLLSMDYLREDSGIEGEVYKVLKSEFNAAIVNSKSIQPPLGVPLQKVQSQK